MSTRPIVVRDPVAIGRALRDARRLHGWTQQQLAVQAGVGQPTVSNVERGTTNTPVGSLLRILAALGLDLAVLPRRRTDAGAAWDD